MFEGVSALTKTPHSRIRDGGGRLSESGDSDQRVAGKFRQLLRRFDRRASHAVLDHEQGGSRDCIATAHVLVTPLARPSRVSNQVVCH